MRLISTGIAALLLCSCTTTQPVQRPQEVILRPIGISSITADTTQMVKAVFVVNDGKFAMVKQPAPVVVKKQMVKPAKKPPQKSKPK